MNNNLFIFNFKKKMKHFLIKLAFFIFFFCIISEFIIRIFLLVPDIPERYTDKYGIQRYKPGQSGHYTKAKEKWNVNEYGWLGTFDTDKDTIISIIGDSYIENIMNPLECNQGSILKSFFPNYSFFEAGRSGVTFIEAMEISKILDIEVVPQYQLLYVSDDDFYESISEITRYNDRLQISIDNQQLLFSQLKSPRMKKVLYNIKLLYYLYLKYPIFVSKQNKGEAIITSQENNKFDSNILNKLFIFCSNNYNLDKLIFVFHPNSDSRIIALTKKYGIKTILLDSKGDKEWNLSNHNEHWSCYGHNQAAIQVGKSLSELIRSKRNKINGNNNE